jgi:hypothetical protein
MLMRITAAMAVLVTVMVAASATTRQAPVPASSARHGQAPEEQAGRRSIAGTGTQGAEEAFKPENVIAFAAAVIALAALAVAVWQGMDNRKHNRMMVVPRIRFDLLQQLQEPVRLFMVNAGTGPAIIESFTFQCDGKAIEPPTFGGLATTIKELGLTGDFFIYIPYPGDTIAAGEERDILRVTLRSVDDEWPYFRERLQRIIFECKYSSIYAESQVARADGIGTPQRGA